MRQILSILVIFLCIQTTRTYASIPEEVQFVQMLNEVLSKLESNTSTDRLPVCVAELKRMSTMYPNEWIIYYYISLYEIQQTFSNLSADNEDILNDAMANINLLKRNKNADKSEISTIEGYYYYAIIAKNPSKNGQIYYKNVLESYQKALKYNPENPRAQLLLLMFRLNMSRFTGNNEENNFYDNLLEIEEIFQKETNSYLKPSWGENTLIALKKTLSKN